MPTSQEIASFWEQNANNPEAIKAAMAQYGITPEQAAAATGQDVNNFRYGDYGGRAYSNKQVTDFIAGGGDPNQWAQQNGITNQDTIHQLATQARGVAGSATPTGDAALQAAWQNYKQYNPGGAGVSDYNSFVRNIDPGRADAIRAGTYSGAFNDMRDYAPGGIYYGKNITYQQAGLGSRGDGLEGDVWAATASGPSAPSAGSFNAPPGGTAGAPASTWNTQQGPLSQADIYKYSATSSNGGGQGQQQPSFNWGSQPAQQFNTPVLDALYAGQQQRMQRPDPTFNFQSKPSTQPVGALTQAIAG